MGEPRGRGSRPLLRGRGRGSTKYIWVVGGGHLAIPLIRQILKRGFRPLVTDGSQRAPARSYAEFFHQVDTSDIDANVAFANELMTDPRYENIDIHGVITSGHDVARTVAAIHRTLGLSGGISEETTEKLNNKLSFRQNARDRNLRQYLPRWFKPITRENLHHKELGNVKGIEFPAIVKPLESRASRGISVVRNNEDLEDAVKLAFANSKTGDDSIIIEQLMEGSEHSAELILDDNGREVFFNIVDRVFNTDMEIRNVPSTTRMEIGHINPTTLYTEVKYIHSMMFEIANKFDIRGGIIKCDVMIVDGQPKILETATRLSGGFDSQETTPLSSGKNPMGIMLSLSSGDPFITDDIIHNNRQFAAAVAAFPQPGRVTHIDTEKQNAILAMPGIENIHYLVDERDIIYPYSHNGNRPAFVIAVGETRNAAWDRAFEAAKLVVDTFTIQSVRF